MFGPADPKFFHDGVTALVDANLVTVDHTNRGELMLRLNRRGAKLAEPNFVLPW
jgi:hypothetical protein